MVIVHINRLYSNTILKIISMYFTDILFIFELYVNLELVSPNQLLFIITIYDLIK